MTSVSVCVPTYNGGEYLRECLESIVNQSFADLEILCVDDGSTDDTVDILLDFARQDSRFRIIHNPRNLGLVGNWNQCVRLAQGDWIKFVFQDDYLFAPCIALMLDAGREPIVFCRREFVFQPGTDAQTISLYESLPTIRDLFPSQEHVVCGSVQGAVLGERRNFFGEPTASLLHRRVFNEFGLFNTDLAHLCDLEYWIRVSINTGFAYVDEPLAIFRYHSSGTSAANRDGSRDERISIFDNLVIAHEFAYGTQYAPLRQFAAEATPKRNLRKEFARSAAWISARTRAARQEGRDDGEEWVKNWARLQAKYPQMTRSLHLLPHYIRGAWQRHLGWRL